MLVASSIGLNTASDHSMVRATSSARSESPKTTRRASQAVIRQNSVYTGSYTARVEAPEGLGVINGLVLAASIQVRVCGVGLGSMAGSLKYCCGFMPARAYRLAWQVVLQSRMCRDRRTCSSHELKHDSHRSKDSIGLGSCELGLPCHCDTSRPEPTCERAES